MDGAAEGMHHGHPDFRVRNRIFATLWPGQSRSVLRLPIETAEGVADATPEKFRVVSRGGKWGWLNVNLQSVSIEEYQELAEIAHAGVS
jgi:hypothetical protein